MMFKRVLFSWFVGCLLQSDLYQAYESCQHFTCHECITDPEQCVWCSDDNLQPDKRCQPATLPAPCSSGLEEPAGAVNVIDADNRDFRSDRDHVIQLKPQRIHIKLRVGKPEEFEFSFKPAENYPVDLYFLIDASNSMRDVRDGILKKSEEIYNVLKKLTDNIYLGLGSFIEKNRVPYEGNTDSIPCYSFKHSFDLTDNLKEFNDSLTKLKFGFNYDPPEGGLDGLAQVMKCKDKIKWRSASRKVIIFVTDAPFHHAGDGKWSGLIKPYDATKCYLNDDGYYTKENEMDYPSVSSINKLVADEQFTILFFIVTKEYTKYYKPLSQKLSSTFTVQFESDTISEKLEGFYKNITANLLLNVKMASEYQKYFQINFNPDCTEGADCKVYIGEEKHLKGTIKLKEYYGKDHASISIVQQALKESVLLDVDIISSCSCEDKHETISNSTECSSAGSKQCGICSCNAGRSGPLCACVDNGAPTTGGNQTCVKDNVVCSGNGNCICGGCICNRGFGGYYCQYRTDNCKRDTVTKEPCSGHGRCQDGQCDCNTGWRGETCDCPLSPTSCRDADGIECSNRGHCECGHCKCNTLPDWDVRKYGDYCDSLPCENCHRKQCQMLIDCVSCRGTNCPEECRDRMTFVNVTDDLNSNWNVCTNVRVAIGCYSNFSYAYDDDKQSILLYLTSEPNCIESFYIYGGISLGVLLLAGIATLVAWKLMSEAQDRAEFEKFIARARDEDEEILNACYNPPTTTYQNPTFNKLSFRKASFH